MTTEVVISGAGPDGLMLACELALADIRTVVLEPPADRGEEPEAEGLHDQVAHLLDHRGLRERLTATAAPVAAMLAERAAELGVQVRRGHQPVDLEQDDVAVTVDVTGPEGTYRLQADYVVDARSATRTRSLLRMPNDRSTVGTAGVGNRVEHLRDRRVFLIGDAARAHDATRINPGVGRGLVDALNLGWKLAAAVLGDAGPDLLDSYERERGPATLAGTDLGYDMGGEQTGELVGRLAPEMTLQTVGGPVRLAELTTRALPLLVDLTAQGALAAIIAPWHDEVDVLRARPTTASPATTALFLRPDCFVAWSSASSSPTPAEREALRAAAERWLGPGRDAQAARLVDR